MKRVTPILATSILTLGLVACGDAEEPAPALEETSTAESTTAQAEPATFKIGEPVNIGYDGDVVNLTLTEAQVGGECRYGTVDYMEPTTDADGKLVQLWAEVEPEYLTHNTWTMAEDPEVITADGFTAAVGMAWECESSTEGHRDWSEGVDMGEKIRVYEAYRVPDDFVALKFGKNRIEREELESAAASATTAASKPATTTAKAVAETTSTSAVAQEPYVVRCLEGTPGPAEWSDGSIAHSEDCFQQLGGPEYLEAERQAGLVPNGGAAVNGYGYAENGARNPSSGEVQAYHGCQDGYIDDPELCAAAESVVRAADPEGEIYG